jgi:hypothetical protein
MRWSEKKKNDKNLESPAARWNLLETEEHLVHLFVSQEANTRLGQWSTCNYVFSVAV